MSMRYPGGLIAPTPVNQQYPSGVWTGQQSAPYQAGNVWANDSSFKNTTLLLHGDGATRSFTQDASTNNFQITLNGDTKPNNLTPFITNGYWSNYFDGSGDYLSIADNVAFTLGSGNFTIESWILPVSLPSSGSIANIAAQWASTPNSAWLFAIYNNGGTIQLLFQPTSGGSETIISKTFAFAVGSFYHVAAVRNSNVITLYVNGSAVGTTTSYSSTIDDSTTAVTVGSRASGALPFTGYISNFRLVKGTAVYTSNFTPSTTPLTAITNTSLLTCQSSSFIDNSTNAFAITKFGDTAVSMQQPFTAPSGTSLFGSGYFDGTGDYLTSSYNINWSTFGSYTLEFWVYHTSMSATNQAYASTGGTGFTNFYNYANGRIGLGIQGTNEIVSASGVITANQWYHVAYTYNGTTTTVYVNGVSVASGTTGVYSNNSAGLQIANGLGGLPVYGYMSNFRIVNSVLYTTTFTPPTAPLTPVSGTSLLTLQTNGPENNNGFLDSSLNSFPITRNGNTTQGSLNPYQTTGYWSTYFTGSSTYLYFANNAALSFGTGDFCVEAWVYKQRAANEPIIDSRATNNAAPWALYIDGSNFPYFYDGTSYTSTIAITLNAWNHVAVTRSSGTLKIFINGVQGYSATVTTNLDRSGGNQVIGATVVTFANSWSGYMSNFRIVKGSAVYTSAFIPPTAPLTAISGTSLLTFQSNRFVDNSSNAFTFTIVGSPSVQNFQPFTLPALQYTPQVFGGSAYFDGTGDYLSYSETAALNAGTGDFTVECWVYHLTSGALQGYLYNSNGGTGGGINFRRTSSNTLQLSHDAVTDVLTTTATIPINAWTHVAVTRSSGTVRLFINGVVGATATYTGNFTNTPATGTIGAINGSFTWNGYMTDMRYVVGTAVYTSAFTLPTAPLAPIAKTQLLTNFTNAAIFDNSGMNNLETVGNAQIDTSVVKYGTSSMYFDGNGDYLIDDVGPQFAFGTSDFTIELWVNPITVSAVQYLVDTRNPSSTTSAGVQWFVSASAKFGVYVGTTAVITASTNSLVAGVWTHLVLVKSNGTWRIFINGVADATTGTNTTSLTQPYLTIACSCNQRAATTTDKYSGYMDDIRITTGVARYVTNFTPPVARMPNQ